MAETQKDFIDVSVPTFREKVIKEIRALETQYHKKFTPFDRYGAIQEFDDYCDDYNKAVERASQRRTAPPEFKTAWDWHKYADPKRFELIAETDDVLQNTKTGYTVPTKIGVNRQYVNKVNGSKVGIFVPNAALEKEAAAKETKTGKGK